MVLFFGSGVVFVIALGASIYQAPLSSWCKYSPSSQSLQEKKKRI
jgi:hypothetical protein